MAIFNSYVSLPKVNYHHTARVFMTFVDMTISSSRNSILSKSIHTVIHCGWCKQRYIIYNYLQTTYGRGEKNIDVISFIPFMTTQQPLWPHANPVQKFYGKWQTSCPRSKSSKFPPLWWCCCVAWDDISGCGTLTETLPSDILQPLEVQFTGWCTGFDWHFGEKLG